MTIHIPMQVSFRVSGAAISSELEVIDLKLVTNNKLNLVLVAERDTKICLSGGELLSEVEVHFTLSSKWKTATELDRGLTENDIGFLCHTREENGKAFVHGAAIWPEYHLPEYLLAEHLSRYVQFTISSLSEPMQADSPIAWGTNREHSLKLSSIRLMAQQDA